MSVVYDDGRDFGNSACRVLGFPAEATMRVELTAESTHAMVLNFTVAVSNGQLMEILRGMERSSTVQP